MCAIRCTSVDEWADAPSLASSYHDFVHGKSEAEPNRLTCAPTEMANYQDTHRMAHLEQRKIMKYPLITIWAAAFAPALDIHTLRITRYARTRMTAQQTTASSDAVNTEWARFGGRNENECVWRELNEKFWIDIVIRQLVGYLIGLTTRTSSASVSLIALTVEFQMSSGNCRRN